MTPAHASQGDNYAASARMAFRDLSAALRSSFAAEPCPLVLDRVAAALTALTTGIHGRVLALTPLEEVSSAGAARVRRFRLLAIELVGSALMGSERTHRSAQLLARACVHDADHLARVLAHVPRGRAREAIRAFYGAKLGAARDWSSAEATPDEATRGAPRSAGAPAVAPSAHRARRAVPH